MPTTSAAPARRELSPTGSRAPRPCPTSWWRTAWRTEPPGTGPPRRPAPYSRGRRRRGARRALYGSGGVADGTVLLAGLAGACGLHRLAGRLAEAFLAPGVAANVIPVPLPEPGAILRHQLEARDPLGALPEVEMRDDQPHGTPVLGRQRVPVVMRGEDDVVVEERLEREVRRVVRGGVDHDVAGRRAGARVGQQVPGPDATPVVVEPAPARDAVHVGLTLHGRQDRELGPRPLARR